MESNPLRNLIELRMKENMQATIDIVAEMNQYSNNFEEEIHLNTFGPTAAFWQSFLDMTQTLLDYVKSFRTGDWELHFSSMERLLV